MKTKFTPGPWVINHKGLQPPQGDFDHIHAESNTALQAICKVVKRHDSPANAALIAAAPDMLHALQEILEGLEHAGCSSPHCSGTCHYCATRRRARAAIQKATGEA